MVKDACCPGGRIRQQTEDKFATNRRWRIRRRTNEIGQLTGEFVDRQTKLVNSLANSYDGQTKLVNSLANSSTDRRNWSTHWRIRRRTDEIGQLTGEFVRRPNPKAAQKIIKSKAKAKSQSSKASNPPTNEADRGILYGVREGQREGEGIQFVNTVTASPAGLLDH
jgi:hypothetical protein